MKHVNKKIEISYLENGILSLAQYQYRYIARNENGNLLLFKKEPKKESLYWTDRTFDWISLGCTDAFNFIKWEDDKAWSVGTLRFNTEVKSENKKYHSYFLTDLDDGCVDAVILSRTSTKDDIEKAIMKTKEIADYVWKDLLENLPQDCIVIDKWNSDKVVY